MCPDRSEPPSAARPDARGRFPGFTGNVLKLGGGATLTQVLALAASPLLTRLFTPDAFGVAAVFTSVVAVFTVVACLRYDFAILLPEEDRDAGRLLAASLGIATAFSLALIPVVAAGGERAAAWFHTPELVRYGLWVPPTVFAGGVLLAGTAWATRRKWFGALSAVRVSQSAITTATQLGLGWAGVTSAAGLIAGIVAGTLAAALFLAARCGAADRRLVRAAAADGGIPPLLRRYRKFPLFSGGSALLNTVSWQVPAFLLAVFFTPAVVGFYALGARVLRGPMNILGSSLSQVFFQEATRAAREGTLSELVDALFRRLVTFGLFPLLSLAVVGDILFATVFGEPWREAGVYTQLLSVWSFLWFVSSPLSTLFSVLERQELGFSLNVANLATRVGSIVVGGLAGDARLALLLFSLSGVLVYGLLGLFILGLSGVPRGAALRMLLGELVRFLPAALLLAGLRWLGAPEPVTLGAWGVSLIAFAIRLLMTDPVLRRLVNRG